MKRLAFIGLIAATLVTGFFLLFWRGDISRAQIRGARRIDRQYQPRTAADSSHDATGIGATNDVPSVTGEAASGAAPAERSMSGVQSRALPLASQLSSREPLVTSAVRDRGRATALATVESIVAFALAEEKEKIGEMIAWTWKASADLSFSGVPEPWRSQAGSVENLQGMAEIRVYSDVGAIQLLHEIVISPTEEVVALRLSRADGSIWERTYHLQKAGDSWTLIQRPSQVIQTVLVLKGEYLSSLSFEREYGYIQTTSGPKPPRPK